MADRSAREATAAAYARIAADGEPGIFIELIDREAAMAAAAAVDAAVADGASRPLAGRTLAVKGNIDVAGHRTTAGCPSYGSVPTRSAPVVRHLEAAGAVVVAITNLDQFATGLVGTRSPHGVCPNAHWPNLISGGSSSGSAVAVARDLVDLALGTDTAGSGRVPAAANGITGLKPTRGRLSTVGVVPACASLDCVSVFARSVDAAAEAVALAGRFQPDDPWSRRAPAVAPPARTRLRLGVPTPGDLDFGGDPGGARRFAAAVDRLVTASSAEAVCIDIGPFVAAGDLLYDGAFVAERYAAVGAFVDAHPADVDPVVGAIVAAAGRLPAWQLARDLGELARLRRATERAWSAIDLLVVPSVPRIPTVAEVEAEPVVRNRELGRYTNFVNLLDLCALTVPAPEPGAVDGQGPPPSLTLVGPAWAEATLVSAGRRLPRGRPASHRTG